MCYLKLNIKMIKRKKKNKKKRNYQKLNWHLNKNWILKLIIILYKDPVVLNPIKVLDLCLKIDLAVIKQMFIKIIRKISSSKLNKVKQDKIHKCNNNNLHKGLDRE